MVQKKKENKQRIEKFKCSALTPAAPPSGPYCRLFEHA